MVIEDRVAKEQARRKAEQEEEELKAATKVSCGWGGKGRTVYFGFVRQNVMQFCDLGSRKICSP